MSIKIEDKFFVPFISPDVIDKAVRGIAEQINRDYKDKEPIFVSTLNGAFMFTSDLMKVIEVECNLTFIKVCSYCGDKSSGVVNEILGLSIDIEGRDVIILEDIVDSGMTINVLHKMMAKFNPKSFAVATFIYKPNCYKGDVKIDYKGIVMENNNFIVGYGLDYNQKGRNLPEIYILEEC